MHLILLKPWMSANKLYFDLQFETVYLIPELLHTSFSETAADLWELRRFEK
jgi:hypothetical protein